MPDAVAVYSEKRVAKFWEIDGLPLLVPSALTVFWGLWGARYSQQHHDLIGYALLSVVSVISADLDYGSSKSIQFLKNRTTRPRTGYNEPPDDEEQPVRPNPATWKPLFPEDGRPKWLRYWEWPGWVWLLVVPVALAGAALIMFPIMEHIDVLVPPSWLMPVCVIGLGPLLWLARTPSSFPAVTGLGLPVMGFIILLRPITVPNRWDFLVTGSGVMGTIIGTLMLVRYLRNNPVTE